MVRTGLISTSLLALAACCDQTSLPHGNGTAEIISAVLARQPDLVAKRKAFLAVHPEEKGYFEGLADIRLCVARETAGSDGDFDSESISRPGPEPNDPGNLSERWTASDRRFAITDVVRLPKHLRWNNILAFCPSGTLRLGNPVIVGDRARVFVENKCSGWCGWGGEIRLRRENGQWLVEKEMSWWQA